MRNKSDFVKRPLALWCLVFVSGTLTAYDMGFVPLCICAGVFAVLFTVSLSLAVTRKYINMKRLAIGASAALLAFFIAVSVSFYRICLVEKYSGESVRIVSSVEDVKAYGVNYYRVRLKVREIDGVPALFELYAFSNDYVAPYDLVETAIVLDGENGEIYPEGVAVLRVVGCSSNLMRACGRISEGITIALRSAIPGNDGGIADAVTTGNRSGIEYTVLSALYRSGVAHIIVVSGMHLSILFALITRLLSLMHVPRAVKLAMMIPTALFLALVVGFTPSVMRAGIMVSMVSVARLLRRSPDKLTTLAFAAAFIVLFNRSFCVTPAFLLSFASTFAVQIVVPAVNQPILKRLRDRNWNWRLRSFVATLVGAFTIVFVTAPVLLFLDMKVSIVAPVANLLIVGFIPVVMLLSLVVSPVYWIFGPATAAVIGYPLKLVCLYIRKVCVFLSGFRFAAIDCSADWLKLWVVCAGVVIVAACVLFAPRKRLIAAVLGCLCLLLCGICLKHALTMNTTQITVLGYGNQSIVIESGGKTAVFHCGKNEYTERAVYDDSLLHERDRELLVCVDADSLLLRGLGYERVIVPETFAGIDGTLAFDMQDLHIDFIVKEGEISCAVCTAGDKSVLLVFDCENVPTGLGSCDIILLLGDSPDNFGDFSGTVLRTDGFFGEKTVIYIDKNGRTIVAD